MPRPTLNTEIRLSDIIAAAVIIFTVVSLGSRMDERIKHLEKAQEDFRVWIKEHDTWARDRNAQLEALKQRMDRMDGFK